MVAKKRSLCLPAFVITMLTVVVTGSCVLGEAHGAAGEARVSQPTTSNARTRIPEHSRSTPLSAPKTSFAQDTKYLTDVTVADPGLASYEQKQGNVALRALLTDGSAFCALLARGGGIDQSLIAEATGARNTESKTHLPLSVATFNTVESVALLALCPSEQKWVPTSVRSKIRALGKALSKRSN
jgi:hypothetical protein